MKQLALCRHVVFLAVVLFAQDSLGEDFTRSNLPEGAVARLGKGLEGHRDRVYSVVFSPDGATLASGIGSLAKSEDGTVRLGDGTVRLWDVASGREIAVLEGHTHWVRSLSFSPDGTTLASSSENSVRLWDVASGRETAVLEGHTDRVRSVSFSPDGTTLASGSWDETVRLWDVASGRETVILEGHTDGVHSLSFSPDGTTLASGSEDGTVLLWDMTPYIGPATPTAIHTPETVPTQTALLANYPNPFNSRTHIAYRLAAPGPVRLSVYNALGQPVRALVDEFQDAGAYQVAWDARDDRGASVSSGVYLTGLRHAHGMQARRLLYLK